MNQLCLLRVVVVLGFLLPAACPGQTITRGGEARTQDAVEGHGETKFTNTNAPGAGNLSIEMKADRSGTHALGSTMANASAMRFTARAVAEGTPPLTVGSPDGGLAHARISSSLNDSITITSASLPPDAHEHAVARVRLLIDSRGERTGNQNWAYGGVFVNLMLANTMSVWSTNSVNGFPNGEILIDVPVQVDGINAPYTAQNFLLSATAGANATSYEDGHFTSATADVTVTWGGFVSLKLTDGTVIADFTATGASGDSYRSKR